MKLGNRPAQAMRKLCYFVRQVAKFSESIGYVRGRASGRPISLFIEDERDGTGPCSKGINIAIAYQ